MAARGSSKLFWALAVLANVLAFLLAIQPGALDRMLAALGWVL